MNLTLRLAILAVVLSVASPGPAAAKSYHHPLIEQAVTLGDNGRLDVLDARTYRFDGEFHNAFITVVPIRGGDVEYGMVEAMDGGDAVRNVTIDGGTLRWQYDARDEERTFGIRYRLTGEVTRALDAALVDRQFLEEEHAPVDEYRFTLNLPRPARLFKIFAITSRGLVGELTTDTTSGVGTIRLQNIRENEWVRLRILFDPDQVPLVAQLAEPRHEQWLAETASDTQAWRDSVRGGRNLPWTRLPTWLAPVMALIAGGFSWWCYRTWRSRGLEPEVADIGPYFREPPEEIPPAVVPYIMNQFSPGTTVAGQAIGATLLDFARRGLVTLRERRKEGFLGIGDRTEVDFALVGGAATAGLTPFEQAIWQMLVSAKKSDDTVTPAEMKAFFVKHPTWIQNWSDDPRRWYETTHGTLLVGGHGCAMAGMIVAGIAVMAGLILLGIFSGNRIVLMTGFVGGLTAGLVGIVSGAALPRWKPEALLRARKWKAYSKFLSDFSAMEEAPAEHYKLWDHHFVYATALGVARAYLANLKKLMVQHPDQFSSPAWIGGHGAGSLNAASNVSRIQSNLESIQANLKSLESALTTATSSGGGFSGGGAGGSSGGGGSSGAS